MTIENLKKKLSRLYRSEAIYKAHLKASSKLIKELFEENVRLKKKIQKMEKKLK